MNSEFEQRFERKMEFILDTLAAVTAKNDETAEIVRRLAERQDKTERNIKGIRFLLKHGIRQMIKTDQKVAELAEQQKITDERFRAFSEKFDRWLDRRNGTNGHGSTEN